MFWYDSDSGGGGWWLGGVLCIQCTDYGFASLPFSIEHKKVLKKILTAIH